VRARVFTGNPATVHRRQRGSAPSLSCPDVPVAVVLGMLGELPSERLLELMEHTGWHAALKMGASKDALAQCNRASDIYTFGQRATGKSL
jgi:hypothetical protein